MAFINEGVKYQLTSTQEGNILHSLESSTVNTSLNKYMAKASQTWVRSDKGAFRGNF